MSIEKKKFGIMPSGDVIYSYKIDNGKGLSAEIISYGGIVTRLLVADKNGCTRDVVLGRSSLEQYLKNDGYLGAIIGRHANRIAKGSFTLGNECFNVGINENGNSLHGGREGFDKKVWNVLELPQENAIELSYVSKDGEEGFPGELDVTVKYTVTDDNALKIEYSASSDKDTLCNLTNHSYFNLNGHDSGKIYGHVLQINSGFYTPNDDEGMPTGEVLSVFGTPFDYRVPKPIGQDINADFEQIQKFGGYDHNYAIQGRGLRLAAVATGDSSDITMQVYTDCPAMQLYTSNMLGSGVYKDGEEYGTHSAFCLEAQAFPNAMAHSHYPDPILRQSEKYTQTTIYRFV